MYLFDWNSIFLFMYFFILKKYVIFLSQTLFF